MKKENLQINAEMLLIPDFSDGDSFFGLIRDFIFYMPGYQPQMWAADSAEGSKLSLMELRSLVQQGPSVLHWKRKTSPRAEGAISRRLQTPTGQEHAAHRLRLSVKNDEQVDWLVSYLCYSAASDGVDFACFGTSYNGPESNNEPMRMEAGVCTQLLRRTMPDLCWGTIFGRAYVELFGLDKLLSSPAYQVEQLTPDAVYIQLTQSIFDMRDRPAEVRTMKNMVKRHLDENIFFDSRYPLNHAYRTPVFQFQ
ncbi:hypothetical protein WHX56_03340 [Achromobacter veterisilvae]|uniref:Uncharacterized protein n=1 Tax=Achromobacter veterisilvae TaxID=2069367 RepID=A0ABZ2S3W1_9BURK